MKVKAKLSDGRTVELAIDNQDDFYRLLNGDGPYARGWLQAMTGEYVRVEQIVSLTQHD